MTKTEIKEACEIIDALTNQINVMPCYWKEFVGIDLANRVVKFLAKHMPDSNWAYEEEEEW